MKKFIYLSAVLLTFMAVPIVLAMSNPEKKYNQWSFQSIDTMKVSRDRSRGLMENPNKEKIINQEVENVAKTGATHIGIATPYDEEFLPILRLWVQAARRNNLHVWYRGNFSGWEEWFGYAKIDRDTHIAKTREFILTNPDLFEDGDIFTSCPECENGEDVPYSPSPQLSSYKDFLLEEYNVTKESFRKIHKDIPANYYSMNYDIAMAMMDKETTAAFDGVVAIDHYVASPDELAADITKLAEHSGGKIVLGEFGAPIPDINGDMTELEQKQWLAQAMENLAQLPELEGVNYWATVEASTSLWNLDGSERLALSVLRDFYRSQVVKGRVLDPEGKPIASVVVTSGAYEISTDKEGYFHLPFLPIGQGVSLSYPSYKTKYVAVDTLYDMMQFSLEKEPNAFYSLISWLKTIFSF